MFKKNLFFRKKEIEWYVGKCNFETVGAHTNPYCVCNTKKLFTMHRSFNMNMHGGDMYMTKVLILPSEVPRGVNMISECSMCHIFTNLAFTKCILWIDSYIAQKRTVYSHFSYVYVCFYLPALRSVSLYIIEENYVVKLKLMERKTRVFYFPIPVSLQEKKSLFINNNFE